MTTIGFIGTGTIAAAMVRGLANAGWTAPVLVSPRNAELAAALAQEHGHVTIAKDNQAVVDGADIIFLAVRPQIFDAVMAELVIPAGKAVVSFVATVSMARMRARFGDAVELSRAIPLPFIEQQAGATAIFPPASASVPLFSQLGKAIVVDNEAHLDVLMAATGTMGAQFLLQAAITDWLVAQGLEPALARSFVGQIQAGLSLSAEVRPQSDYATLIHEFSTVGGLNEQLRQHVQDNGLDASMAEGLDGLLRRIRG